MGSYCFPYHAKRSFAGRIPKRELGNEQTRTSTLVSTVIKLARLGSEWPLPHILKAHGSVCFNDPEQAFNPFVRIIGQEFFRFAAIQNRQQSTHFAPPWQGLQGMDYSLCINFHFNGWQHIYSRNVILVGYSMRTNHRRKVLRGNQFLPPPRRLPANLFRIQRGQRPIL
jgi:hypothetical protein